MFEQILDPTGHVWLSVLISPYPADRPSIHAGGAPHDGLAGIDHRWRDHHSHRRLRLARAAHGHAEILFVRRAYGLLGHRLDHLLGSHHFQHTGADRAFRTLQKLDDPPRHRRHSNSNHHAGVGFRRAPRGPRGFWLPVGRGRADSGWAWALRTWMRSASPRWRTTLLFLTVRSARRSWVSPRYWVATLCLCPLPSVTSWLILALLPPWVLIYLVSGREGMWRLGPWQSLGPFLTFWGSGLWRTFLGPYLPDLSGGFVSFWVFLYFVKIWRPKTIRGFGGAPLALSVANATISTQKSTGA